MTASASWAGLRSTVQARECESSIKGRHRGRLPGTFRSVLCPGSLRSDSRTCDQELAWPHPCRPEGVTASYNEESPGAARPATSPQLRYLPPSRAQTGDAPNPVSVSSALYVKWTSSAASKRYRGLARHHTLMDPLRLSPSTLPCPRLRAACNMLPSSSRGLADYPPQPMVVGHPTYPNAGSCLRAGRRPYSGPVLHPKWVSWLRCFRTTEFPAGLPAHSWWPRSRTSGYGVCHLRRSASAGSFHPRPCSSTNR